MVSTVASNGTTDVVGRVQASPLSAAPAGASAAAPAAMGCSDGGRPPRERDATAWWRGDMVRRSFRR